MSDESTAPLRLKPRARSDSASPDEPTTASEAVKADAASVEAEAGSRFRLKPRLSATEEVEQPAASVVVESASASATPLSVAVPLTAAAEPSPILFSSTEAPPAPAAVSTPPAPAPASAPMSVFAPPVRAEQAPGALPPSLPTGGAAPGAVAAAVNPATFPPPPLAGKSLKPENKPAFKVALLAVGAVVVVILGLGTYFGYRAVSAASATSIAASEKSTSASRPAATDQSRAADEDLSAPDGTKPTGTAAAKAAAPKSAAGRLVQKAREAAAARVQDLPSDESFSVSDAAPDTQAPSAAVDLANAEPVPAPTSAPTIVAEVDPSPAFRAWVTAARVSGVRIGAEARAFINGRSFRQGEVVDARLQIVFYGVDGPQKILLFEDATGARIGRKF